MTNTKPTKTSTKTTKTGKPSFTKYEAFVIAIIAFIQFTVILDFMVMSPLGAILRPQLNITPAQFGMVVSAYAYSAGISGLLAAGFADKFDRKKMLLFFYTGFLIGTTLCALATDYYFLVGARIITGIFGGVISSVSMAIVTDLFKMEVRGRVMGFVQMAFAGSQVLGLPIGLFLANKFDWHAPFWLIAGVSLVPGIIIAIYMKPVNAHLRLQHDRNAFQHIWKTLSTPIYWLAFLTTVFLATGGFMLMPFGTDFSVRNLGLTTKQIPLLYLISGIFTLVFGPLTGFLSDKLGKYRIFFAGTLLTMIMVAVYTNLGLTPFIVVVVINVLMFAGIMARMSSSSALISAIPQPEDRGAFMAVNTSVQQLAGGIASSVAGLVISQGADGKLHHYNTLGLIVMASMTICAIMMFYINRQVSIKMKKAVTPQQSREMPAEEFVIE